MFPNLKYQLSLQLVVIIAGFTGILGDLISVPAEQVTFFRTLIAVVSLFPLALWIGKKSQLTLKQGIILFGTGIIVGLHWFTFFYSIKCSTISIAVICLATSTLFMAFVEPVVLKRKLRPMELVLGGVIIIGMVLIYGFESDEADGMFFGTLSAFLATLFTALNARYVKSIPSLTITKYEMLGACLSMTLILGIQGDLTADLFSVSNSDWIYLLVLGLICTSLAFLLSVWVMQHLSPFTVSISLNLEPVYTILLALLIDWYMGTSKEQMSSGFYIGGAIILSAIFTNAYLKRYRKA